MGSQVWRYFNLLLVLTIVLFVLTVAKMMWSSVSCLQLDSSNSRFHLQWPKQVHSKYAKKTKLQEIRNTENNSQIFSREIPVETPVTISANFSSRQYVTEAKPVKDWSPEEMPDRWCQYLVANEPVNPHLYNFLTTGESLCTPPVPFMMILVPSVCTHVKIRNIIRQTWGSVVRTGMWPNGQKLPSIKLAFLFGSPPTQVCSQILKNETNNHGDIIVSEFTDSYPNLTLKSVSALKWASTYCPHVRYIMKCDEDTFVHLPRLVKLIRHLNSSETLIGCLAIDKPPMESGRWKVNAEQYPFRRYPTYLQGQVYVIPGKIVPKLFRLSAYFNSIPIEDVYVTGILARCAGATLCQQSHSLNFNPYGLQTTTKKSKCYFNTIGRISVTKISPSVMTMIWDSFKNNSECSSK